MPVISRFDGIIIKMYFIDDEHNPPHIHALYGDYNGIFLLEDGEMLAGDIPGKQQKAVTAFINCYRDKLYEMWNTQEFELLPPIK
ncbi:MAG: DUF4160 domain-containing protein [Lachnospiraceae bacterium]|nr:DUF4160 domain-containing protein [Lachnospiraceae bacterium]